MTALHQLTDEQLGNEIGLLISDRVDSSSPPAGVFLAIQDRLGSQDIDWSLSRLIGSFVPGASRLPAFTGMLAKTAAAITVAVAIVTILALQGRDTDQGGIVPAAQPSADAESEIQPFEGSLVVPAIEHEAGSDEAAILDVTERVVRAINSDDWEGLIATCDPRLAVPLIALAAEQMWDSSVGPYIGDQAYNRRNVQIRIFGDRTANVNFDEFSNDELFAENILESYVEVDGAWYMNYVLCNAGNNSLIEPAVAVTVVPIESG